MPNIKIMNQKINLSIMHDGVQPGIPLNESLRFGLQDKKGEVHSGLTECDEMHNFDLTVELKQITGSDKLIFQGEFVHGSPAKRFIYLS